MADNVMAFFLQNPKAESGAGIASDSGPGGMYPENVPVLLWGQGTPDGDRSPFKEANKGSLYMAVNQTDDVTHLWQKIDEGDDNADWVPMDHKHVTRSALFDISAADSEQVVLYADRPLLITAAFLLWNEATAASGAAEGDITIGTATGGAEIVAATAYGVSKASGSRQVLSIVDGAVALDGSVFASHDQAPSAAGTYFLVLVWHYTA